MNDETIAQLRDEIAKLTATVTQLIAERDEYRKLYLSTLELCRKLELGIMGQKRKRYSTNESQLTLSIVEMLTGNGPVPTSSDGVVAPRKPEEKSTAQADGSQAFAGKDSAR
jgi:hypothetical protein